VPVIIYWPTWHYISDAKIFTYDLQYNFNWKPAFNISADILPSSCKLHWLPSLYIIYDVKENK
jgi:hypothetical protein